MKLKFNSMSELNSLMTSEQYEQFVAQENARIDEFRMIVRGARLPLIYESGCGSGLTTAQICRHLSERGVERYKLVGHDVRESLVKCARNRFSGNDNVILELRSGSDYSDIPDGSVDGISSLNTMIPFLYVYDIIGRDIPLQIKLYKDHPCIEVFLKVLEVGR